MAVIATTYPPSSGPAYGAFPERLEVMNNWPCWNGIAGSKRLYVAAEFEMEGLPSVESEGAPKAAEGNAKQAKRASSNTFRN